MTSPWGKIGAQPVETINLTDIMSEQYAHYLQDKELKRHLTKTLTQKDSKSSKTLCGQESEVAASSYSAVAALSGEAGEWENYSELLKPPKEATLPTEVIPALQEDPNIMALESDAVIAQMLQSEFDYEYNQELRRIEQQKNKHSKVTVTLEKFRRNEFLCDTRDENYEDRDEQSKHDWDRFETNEKILDNIPKCGFKMDKAGEMITKHDANLCGVRNACRVMSFPPEFPTGDGAGFDMKLSNKVFNQLKTYSRRGVKKNRMSDRKENVATAEMGIDAPTRLLLYRLINNQILEQINGVISTGKEAVILHANSDPAYAGLNQSSHGVSALVLPHLMPKECAIKIFKTTLNEFKQRDYYIKDDYRFKDRFSKQNNRVIINMWAEKEMHNLMRMKNIGLNVPDVVILKKHVLVMSFIGDKNGAAPKLKDAHLNDAELSCAYDQIVNAMYKMYNEAKLVHADLSEYNILWHDNKCWFIDVAQSVEPEHPSALEFLMRDCGNIVNFFTKRDVSNIYNKEQLFEHITSMNAETHNVATLERIYTRGANIFEATNSHNCPDELKQLEYPFELAWEKSQADRKKSEETAINSGIEKLHLCEPIMPATITTKTTTAIEVSKIANNENSNTAKN